MTSLSTFWMKCWLFFMASFEVKTWQKFQNFLFQVQPMTVVGDNWKKALKIPQLKMEIKNERFPNKGQKQVNLTLHGTYCGFIFWFIGRWRPTAEIEKNRCSTKRPFLFVYVPVLKKWWFYDLTLNQYYFLTVIDTLTYLHSQCHSPFLAEHVLMLGEWRTFTLTKKRNNIVMTKSFLSRFNSIHAHFTVSF